MKRHTKSSLLWYEIMPAEGTSYIPQGQFCGGILRGQRGDWNPYAIHTFVGIVSYFYTTSAFSHQQEVISLYSTEMQHLW